jgi:hypothetical protein
MTIPSLLRSRRVQLLLAVLVVVAVASWFLPSLLSRPADADVGGPPESGVAPPFDEDTFGTITVMSLPSGPVCTWLDEDAVTDVVGAKVSSSANGAGCTWSGGGLDIAVSTIAQPIVAAFPDVAEDWPEYPETVAEPVSGLFLLDGDRAALLLDAGDDTVMVLMTEPGADRARHRNVLLGLADLLAG